MRHVIALHRRKSILAASLVLLAGALPQTLAYQLAARWTNTASGAGGVLGSAVTLTWSLVPDGTPIASLPPSNLVAFMDTHFGAGAGGDDLTQRPWFWHFEHALDRWSQLGGATYVYEPHDDGTAIGSFPGVLGVRGDVRIGGALIDGGGGVLGFGHLPNNGDLVLDTGDQAFFTNPADDYRRFHTVMMHEHGHGLGLAHVESIDAAFLMEPILNLDFDGPQLDDIRGLHRAYGDVLGKSHGGRGNDQASHATPLGRLSPGTGVALGSDAGQETAAAADARDFISLDDDSDVDFFSFEVDHRALLDIELIPRGPAYYEGPQWGPQQWIDTAAISNMTLAVFDADGTLPLGIANEAPAGETESLFALELPRAGRYFARITGTANDVQLYELRLSVRAVPEPAGVPWSPQAGILLLPLARSLRVALQGRLGRLRQLC